MARNLTSTSYGGMVFGRLYTMGTVPSLRYAVGPHDFFSQQRWTFKGCSNAVKNSQCKNVPHFCRISYCGYGIFCRILVLFIVNILFLISSCLSRSILSLQVVCVFLRFGNDTTFKKQPLPLTMCMFYPLSPLPFALKWRLCVPTFLVLLVRI